MRSISGILGRVGWVLLVLLLWYRGGWYIGGDAYSLGGYMRDLEFVLPYAVVGALLMIVGVFIGRENFQKNKTLLAGVLLLIIIGFLSSSLSVAIGSGILWLVLLLVPGVGDQWLIQGKGKRIFWWGSLALATALSQLTDIMVATELVALGAIWGMFHLLRESEVQYRWVYILLGLVLLWFTSSLALIWMMMLVVFLSKLWLVKGRKENMSLYIWGMIVGGALLFMGRIFIGDFSLFAFGPFIEGGRGIMDFLFGFGIQGYLPALQSGAAEYLLPSELSLAQSGLVSWWYEYGLVGTCGLLAVMVTPAIRKAHKYIFPSVVMFLFALLAGDMLQMENGILFLLFPLYGWLRLPGGKRVSP